MGFFKRKVKEGQKSIYEMTPKYASQYREPQSIVEMQPTSDGKLQIELIESTSHPQQGRFYDTTRVIVDGTNPLWINGKPIQNCKVSHYNQSDFESFDNREGTCSRTCYREVLAEFDISRVMQGDQAYTTRLLGALFDQKRIEKYLDGYALQEDSALPCGNYIGKLQDNGGKAFDRDVGFQVHYSYKYKELRKQERAKEEKRAKIDAHYQAINKLNRGIDDDNDSR